MLVKLKIVCFASLYFHTSEIPIRAPFIGACGNRVTLQHHTNISTALNPKDYFSVCSMSNLISNDNVVYVFITALLLSATILY